MLKECHSLNLGISAKRRSDPGDGHHLGLYSDKTVYQALSGSDRCEHASEYAVIQSELGRMKPPISPSLPRSGLPVRSSA